MIKHLFRFILAFVSLGLLFWSCTDLEEDPKSSVTADDFYKTESELVAAVVPVYNALNNFTWEAPMFLQEVSTDELIIPQRGGDWGDNNVWKDLHRHEWKPTLGFVNDAWVRLYGGVARANNVLDELSRAEQTALVTLFISETRVIRAFFYFHLMDLYGGVPIVTAAFTDPENPPAQNTRQQVYDFVVSEINEALPNLEDSFGAGDWGRVSKNAARAILATVYLNAEVYTGSARWSECEAACDAIINSGLHSLNSDYFATFSPTNEGPGNAELIWVVGHANQDGVGFFRHMATLHYNQLPWTPWNGFSVVSDFYNRYDPDDLRLNQFLVGQQVWLAGPKIGQETTDRNGAPLIFTVTINDLNNANEQEGVRVNKWPVDPNATNNNAGNDFALFRYSGILLTKAEALLMQGDAGGALALVNQVRARAFEPDEPLAAVTRDDILNERGFELFWENFRRQDLIRTGHFQDSWSFKTDNNPIRNLYPIPQAQLDANPNLHQNPGY
jgi:hypothetical protein